MTLLQFVKNEAKKNNQFGDLAKDILNDKKLFKGNVFIKRDEIILKLIFWKCKELAVQIVFKKFVKKFFYQNFIENFNKM